MGNDTIFLTLEQIVFIHEDQVERYGGSHGIRDLGLLESAVLRPQTTFGGVDLYPTLFEKGAALVHSLLLNHPFVDANKRTSTVAVLAFFELNNYEIEVEQKELVRFAMNVENKKIGFEAIASWLKKHAKKTP